MQKIGFIGLGIMGNYMAHNILKAGYSLHLYNRTKSKAENLASLGAIVSDSPKDIAETCDIIITMVSDTPDVEMVLFGENGVYDGLSAGKIVVDMSTISSEATKKFAGRIAEKGAVMLDAPVSGGDIGAKNATLTIMVGGDAAAFDKVYAVFETMGKTITHMGESGAGQACKMCNQIMVAASLMGVCEGMMLAAKEGLDPEKLINVIMGGVGASGQLKAYGSKIAARDFAPGFYIDLVVKDLGIVQEAQKAGDLYAPITEKALEMFVKAQEKGYGRDGTQGVVKVFEDRG